jgi:hypothetical protein
VTCGFGHRVNEICALPACYAAYSGNSLRTFRDNLSVPSWTVKDLFWILDYTPRNVAEDHGSEGKNFLLIADTVDVTKAGDTLSSSHVSSRDIRHTLSFRHVSSRDVTSAVGIFNIEL